MNIAIFTDSFPPQTNGVSHAVLQSARKLASRGHHVMVFAGSKTASRYETSDLPNLHIVPLPSLPALVYPRERLVLPFGTAISQLTRFRPDVIHTHTPFGAGWLAVRAARKLHIPLVGTHHTFYDHYLKYLKLDFGWMQRFSWNYTVRYYNRCKLVISPTKALADSLTAGGLTSRIVVMPNSVDTELFAPLRQAQGKPEAQGKPATSQRCSIVYMGRLGYEKSVDVVVRAFAIIKKTLPNLRLMLVGDGPTRKELEHLATELGIADAVHFTGFLYRDDLVRALQASELFMTASKTENMPLSLLEAMAVALPIVAVREKGIAEIVQDDINGLFATTDDAFDMAHKALTILQNPALLARYGGASRSLALAYADDTMIQDLEQLYTSL